VTDHPPNGPEKGGWDPAQYLRFADQRTRPGMELLARIPATDPSTVFDLGCGTGHLTAALALRWPSATVTGLDSSAEMLERARASYPDLGFQQADIADWYPTEPPDLIYSNATLHWLDRHEELFPRLLRLLPEGGVLAVQMPDNNREPSHLVVQHVVDDGPWAERALPLLLRAPVARPANYRQWLGEEAILDQWETIYHHELRGEDPVLEWVMGTLLRPILRILTEAERVAFLDRVAEGYRLHYPPGPDGTTVLPFRRQFLIAVRRTR
jgi:trans-aconitate 2-methyltransferase